MKRWAIVTVALYALFLLLLTVPALLIGWIKWSSQDAGWEWDLPLPDILELFRNWGYWVWLGVLVAAQTLLLLVPIDISERRPTRRRRLLAPIITAAFLLANLFLAGVFALLTVPMRDDVSKVLEVPGEFTGRVLTQVPGVNAAFSRLGLTLTPDLLAIINFLGLVVLFWLVWGLVFYHFARSDTAETLVQRATRWMLRGSILELLVAVPSHVIVRQRGDCCAPLVTFWGITTGISVMMLAFGPGVLFLFAARVRRKKAALAPPVIP